jgi:hypothetical protein
MKKILVASLILSVCTILCAEEIDRPMVEYIDNNCLAVVKDTGESLEIANTKGELIKKLSFARSGRVSSLLVVAGSLFIGKTDGSVDWYSTSDWSLKKNFKVSDFPITALAYSGGKLSAGDQRGKVADVSVNYGNAKTLGGYPEAAVTHLAVSDGVLISLADNSMKPRLWNGSKISGRLDADSAQGFVAAKERVAVFNAQNELILFNKNKLEKRMALPKNSPPVTGGAFSHDFGQKFLALSLMDGAVIINTTNGKIAAEYKGLGKCALAYRPDNMQLAIWNGSRLRFYDAPDRPVATVKVVSDLDGELLIQTNGEREAVQLLSGVEKALRVNTGLIEFSLTEPLSAKILSSDSNREVKRLDLKEEETVSLVIKKNEPVPAKEPELPSLKSGKLVARDREGAVTPRLLRASSKNGSIILASFGPETAVIDLSKGAVCKIKNSFPVTAFDISRDKQKIFLGIGNELQTLTTDGRELGRLKFDGPVTAVAAGEIVAVAAAQKIYFLDGENKARLEPINVGADVSAMALHKGRLAIAAGGDVTVINTSTGQVEPRLFGLRFPAVSSLCWIEEDKYLAASYADGVTLVVNSSSGVRSMDPIKGPGPVRASSASANGLCIVYDAAVHRIDLGSGKVEDLAVKDAASAAYWSTEDNRLAVSGKHGIEFYKGNTKSGEFLLYPDGEWLLINAPLYSYSTTYYISSNEAVDERLVQVQLYYESGTRPLAAEDKKEFRAFSKLKNGL